VAGFEPATPSSRRGALQVLGCHTSRANIGRAKTRAAIRLAESLGLIAIEEAPDRNRRDHQSRRQISLLSAPIKRGVSDPMRELVEELAHKLPPKELQR
jgi:hypothetical protein